MKTITSVILTGFGVSLLAGAILFAATGFDYSMFKFWAPKYENARRQVFENTQSYVQGKVTQISRLRYEYQSASGAQKAALKQLILDEAANVDNTQLPVDLQVFINSLKEN